MSIKSEFSDFVAFLKRKAWSENDFKKLLRVMYECFTIDDVFSTEERQILTKKIAAQSYQMEDIQALSFQDCLAELSEDMSKKNILYHAIADALFADEDYDVQESQFVDKIIRQFELDGHFLREIIKKVRDQHIDQAIRKWYNEEVN